MRLVDHHGFAVDAIAVELPPGLVRIGGSHLDKSKTIPDHVDGKDPSDHAEECLNRSILGAVWKVAYQKFLCRGCHCFCILMLRVE